MTTTSPSPSRPAPVRRPITDAERRNGEAMLRGSVRSGTLAIVAASAFLAAAAWFVWRAVEQSRELPGTVAWSGSAVAAAVFVLIALFCVRPFLRGRRGRVRAAADLRLGEVEASTFRATAAALRREDKDRSTVHYLALTDGGVLVLWPSWEQLDAWTPRDTVTLVHLPKSRWLIHSAETGEPVPLLGVLPPFTRAEARRLPVTGDVLPVDLRELLSGSAIARST